MAKRSNGLGFERAFQQLEKVACRGGTVARINLLFESLRAKREIGKKVTWEEHLEFGLVLYDAGRMPLDAGLFWVQRILVDAGPGEERAQTVYHRDFQGRFEIIRREHGLADGEDWPVGEGPPECEALDREFEAACQRVEADVLCEYAGRLGHPLLKEAADLCRSDRLAFERRVEKGRQWFFGPPDETAAEYLRSEGIID